MDVDIDIEEHDLLDNPVIQNIFPDLSILKKEIYEDPDIVREQEVLTETISSKLEDKSFLSIVDLSEDKKIRSYDSENLVSESDTSFIDRKPLTTFSNKIILGSKPTLQNEIKVGNHQNATEAHLRITGDNLKETERIKTTPLKDRIVFENEKERENVFSSEVKLTDIGMYLERSGKFCRVCRTLFPEKASLYDHKLSVHNYSTNCGNSVRNKTVSSKLRRVQLSTRSGTKSGKIEYGPNNECFHCKKIFPSKPLLIEHIYNVLHDKKQIRRSNTSDVKKILKFQGNQGQLDKAPKMNKESNIPTHKQRRKPMRHRNKKSQQANNHSIRRDILVYRCLYCSYCFVSEKFLISHMITKHKDKCDNVQVKKVLYDDNEECKYCSKKNKNWRSYNVHMQQYHKEIINKTVKVNPKVYIPKIDTISSKSPVANQNDQRSSMSSTPHCYEEFDADDPLENSEKNEVGTKEVRTDSSFLKSVLFKCNRCDINFLTTKAALDHKEHMEMLIHWKCISCQNIFKIHDAPLHERQHLFSGAITVMELSPIELTRVLYKCSQCGIHFTEENYLLHFKTCEIITAESFYCKECDVLIHKDIAKSHKDYHRVNKIKPEDFTIVNSDVLTMENNALNTPVKSTCKDGVKLAPNNESLSGNTSGIDSAKLSSKIKTRRTQTSDDKTNKKVNGSVRKTNPKNKRRTTKRVLKGGNYFQDVCFKLSYCETCKSYVSQLGVTRQAHIESRCAHIQTSVCKYCGLIFTNRAMYTHKLIHKKAPNLKLQDFEFYHMKNGKQILPPIPQYPKCAYCDVHFMSKTAVLGHVCDCSGSDFLTCHVCNIKLAESIFKLHMSFHFYSKIHSKIAEESMLTAAADSNSSHPEPSTSKYEYELKHAELSHTDNLVTLTDKIGNELNDPIIKIQRGTPSHSMGNNKNDENTAPVQDIHNETVHSKSEMSTAKYKTNHNFHLKSKEYSDYELFNVIYCCANCRTTIYTYDEVVEHCQDHLCGVEIETEYCKTLNLKFDRRSNKYHNKFHNSSTKKSSLELIAFDIFYFNMGNDIWTRHIFGAIGKEKAQSILQRSIYKNCTLKMEVIQEGLADLTVYKCNSCCIIVDPAILPKHIENSCFRLRKNPCSFCGLPFLSYLERIKHENIHKDRHITLKSYRVVVFNQENDKKNNKLLHGPSKLFILYECRNCNGIVDKFQRSGHKCEKKYLKRCEKCHLFIPSSDYEAHLRKHEIVPNYIQNNMKIILFGQKDSVMSDTIRDEVKSFGGIVIDFTFYRCVECEVCFSKSQITKMNHTKCFDPNSKLKCPKCDLVFATKNYNRHSKLHETDAEFVRVNMNIIPYTVSGIEANFVPADLNNLGVDNTLEQEQLHLKEITSVSAIDLTEDTTVKKHNNATEKTATLFKCVCGLHFLHGLSIKSHLGHCNSKNVKQTCSKCNLLFNPNVLFDHLLLHHGDKRLNYKFSIIEMSENKCKIISIFKCVNCNTHFLKHENAVSHTKMCNKLHIDRETCKKCNLYFDVSCISHHENNHHTDSVAHIDIINIEECAPTPYNETRKPDDNISTTGATTLKGDIVIDAKKFNLSDESLSQIDLSHYDNQVYKCDLCNTHFLTEGTHRRHYTNGHYLTKQDTCYICGINFSLQSLTKHIYIHHKQMNLKADDIIIKSHVQTFYI